MGPEGFEQMGIPLLKGFPSPAAENSHRGVISLELAC